MERGVNIKWKDGKKTHRLPARPKQLAEMKTRSTWEVVKGPIRDSEGLHGGRSQCYNRPSYKFYAKPDEGVEIQGEFAKTIHQAFRKHAKPVYVRDAASTIICQWIDRTDRKAIQHWYAGVTPPKPEWYRAYEKYREEKGIAHR